MDKYIIGAGICNLQFYTIHIEHSYNISSTFFWIKGKLFKEFGISMLVTFFCHIAAMFWLASCKQWRNLSFWKKTPTNHRLTHWQLSHMPQPGLKAGQWWEIAGSQWQRLRPQGNQRMPLTLFTVAQGSNCEYRIILRILHMLKLIPFSS